MTNRESYRQIFTPLAEKRIQNDECPNCGKPKSKWNRRLSWRCCSVKCTKEFWAKHNKSWSWQQFRFEVFKRDNFTCKNCGNKFDEKDLIADHIKPLAMDGEMWNIANLQTLCITCNKIKTKQDKRDIANYKNGRLKIRTKQLVIG